MGKSFAKIQKPAKRGLNILAENQPKPKDFATKPGTCSMARIRRTALDRWARLLLHFGNQSAYGLQYVACTCCTEFRSSSIFETTGMDKLHSIHLDACITWESSQTSMIFLNTLLAPSNLSWMWIQIWRRFGAMHLKAYYWHWPPANWVVLQCHSSLGYTPWFQVYSFNFPGPTLNRRNLSFPSESAFAMPAGSWIRRWTEYYEAMKDSAMGNKISLCCPIFQALRADFNMFNSLDIQAKVAIYPFWSPVWNPEICVLSTHRLTPGITHWYSMYISYHIISYQ